MNTADAAKQIIALLEEGRRRGAPSVSGELRAFLDELAKSPGLKKPRLRTRNAKRGLPTGAETRVGSRPKRLPEADMAKAIDELARKLRATFENDASFETVLNDPNTQALSKENVLTLYNRVFNSPKRLSTSLTKPDLFNAIRRERINWVRGRA